MAATIEPAAQQRSPATGAPRLLTAQFTPEQLRQSILPRAAWRPFPRASDRAA